MKQFRVIITTDAPEKFGYNITAFSHEQAAGAALHKLSKALGEPVDWRSVEVKKISED